MTTKILDTDTLTLYRQGRPLLVSRVNARPLSEIATTVITVEEQLTGWQALLRRPQSDAQLAETYLRLAEAARALSCLHIFTFTEAAIALEHGATVITRNLRDFQRVPELACENWAD